MTTIIELPHVGESVTEGVIGKWLVEPGQRVERYDPLVEVITDKVSMEAPSPYSGVFVRALVAEGDTVPMGQPICEMEVDGEAPAAPVPDAGASESAAPHDAPTEPAEASGAPEPAAAPEQPPSAARNFEFISANRSVGPTGSGEGGQGRPDALQDAELAGAPASAPSERAEQPDRSHVVSPLVARLSAQHGVDLSTIVGTGFGGRVTRDDVLRAVEALDAGASASAPPTGQSVADSWASAEQAVPAPPPSMPPPSTPEPELAAADAAPPTVESPEEEAAPAPTTSEPAAAEESAPIPMPAASEETDAPSEESAEEPTEESESAPSPAPEAPEPPAPAPDEERAPIPLPAAAERVAIAAPASEPAPPAEAFTSALPLTVIRKTIAEHMARSAGEIPAAWSMVEADVTGLVRARDTRRTEFLREHGVPLTYLPFAAAVVAAALQGHPLLNARWDGDRITLNHRVNLGVAVSTETGLFVPVVRNAASLGVAALAVEIARLAESARLGGLRIDDVQGGTFTLNNTGALGSVVSVPIINHPQAAILTTEAIVKRPVVIEGDAIAVRSMMNVCLAFDHRVCDGAEVGAFLHAVKEGLEAIDESAALD